MNMEYLDQNGKKGSRAFTYINPAANDNVLSQTAQAINALTGNTFIKATRIQRTDLESEPTLDRVIKLVYYDFSTPEKVFYIADITNGENTISATLWNERIANADNLAIIQDDIAGSTINYAIFIDAFPTITTQSTEYPNYITFTKGNLYKFKQTITTDEFSIEIKETSTYKTFNATITKEEE